MATAAAHFWPAVLPPLPAPASPLIPSLSRSPRFRINCLCSSSPQSPFMEPAPSSGTSFKDFPYVSVPHRDLMVDLVSAIETRLEPHLLPCNLPPDVQLYQNQSGTAHAALLVRSGFQSSQIDFMLGSWLHCKLPSGGALNITSLSAYLNASTDAPNFLFELIQSCPTSMVLILDLPPRKELVLNPNYLKTFYEDTKLDLQRQLLEKLPEVKPYFSSSLYIRSVVSPTAILVRIETEVGEKERMEEILQGHVGPIAKEVLRTWLEICACRKREVVEADRVYLEKRDRMTKSKTVEIDLGSNMPRLFGQEVADRVLEALREVF